MAFIFVEADFRRLRRYSVVQPRLGGVPRVEVDGGGLARLHGAHDEDARVREEEVLAGGRGKIWRICRRSP